MEIHKKYRHIGVSYPNVPRGWVKHVEWAIKEIERLMWPRWIPMFIKRRIHYWATGNSVVCIKNRFWHKIRNKLTKGQLVTDIKDKYATVRIYGFFLPEIAAVIDKVENMCEQTCESCGHMGPDVDVVGEGWIYNLCDNCKSKGGL